MRKIGPGILVRNRSFFSCLVIISFMLMFVSISPSGSLIAKESAEVSVAEENGEEEDAHTPIPIQGHLGWDKETGQPIHDPTMRRSRLSQMEMDALVATKGFDLRPITYRSGFSDGSIGRLDSRWLDQVQSHESPVYGLIQFPLPFDTRARIELEEAGVKFYNYVAGNGLYARFPEAALPTLYDLAADSRVLAAREIPVAARIEKELMDLAQTRSAELVPITLQLFDLPDNVQVTTIKGLMAVEDTSLHPTLPLFGGVTTAENALILANLPYVKWIEIERFGRPQNIDSRMFLGTDVLADGWSADGTDINVAVIDSGIDTDPYHQDLPEERIVDQYDFFDDDNDVDATDGHGTHVAGTIGGESAGRARGHAPDADLLIYRLCCNSDGFGYGSTRFQNAMNRAGDNEAHIANNSWGGPSPGEYSTSSEIADRAVRGEYGSQYINMIIAAGNDNDTVHQPATAKNGITVGAVNDGNWSDATLEFTECSMDSWPPGDRACFSNFGPLDGDGDGATRIKPDVVAPGVNIYSTIPGSGGNNYAYYSGTSMAAPGVSGAIAAVLDFHDAHNDWLLEWPETVKALMLATAIDTAGSTDTHGRGVVSSYDMAYSIPGISEISFWGNTIASTGDEIELMFDVADDYEYVNIALTWPDPAGTAELANDLDLYIYADSACSVFVTSASSADDNVEFAHIEREFNGGTWCAKVIGYSISQRQTFGLAYNMVSKETSLSISTSLDNYAVNPGQTFNLDMTVSNSGYSGGAGIARIDPTPGISVEGVTLFTDDGRSHSRSVADIHEFFDSYIVGIGNINGNGSRLVRWELRVDADAEPGVRKIGTLAHTIYEKYVHSQATAETEITIGGSLNVSLTANPTSMPENGGLVAYTVEITNEGASAVNIDMLTDDLHGDLDGKGTCTLPASIDPSSSGGSYTCSYSEEIFGREGDSVTNTVTAVDSASGAQGVGSTTVTLTGLLPQISVTYSADPSVVSESGTDVTFTVTVRNDSPSEPFLLNGLDDNVYGDLYGQGTCDYPNGIEPGDTYQCAFVEFVSGVAGESKTNTVTAMGGDDDGNETSASAGATVNIGGGDLYLPVILGFN